MAGKVRLATHGDVSELIEFIIKYQIERSNIKEIPVYRPTLYSTISFHIGMAKHVAYVYDDDGILVTAGELRSILEAVNAITTVADGFDFNN